MSSSLDKPVAYSLRVGDQSVPLNGYLGKQIKIEFTGQISCENCGRKTKKSFSQGYCYPCMMKLAACDACIMSPEKCHYAAGTCREPEWGETFCMQEHIVYLANSSGLKVGITRGTQVPTRWIDQGAAQAVPIYRVATRHLSGLVEVVFKNYVNDRTNWRTMLKEDAPLIDLQAERDKLFVKLEGDIASLRDAFIESAPTQLPNEQVVELNYPVLQYPSKVTSLNLEKTPVIEGVLLGIKGQYLLLDTGCINLRKYTSYHVNFSA
ncbi:MAG: DUF2797 domain-containing protein [Hahellaceae bacterium]|nr:DUF2797 domain-containing protein [Hahellaceae bacterium]